MIAGVRANRAFLGRAVHFLAAKARIRQFLDIGTGIPTANNTHEVAQRAAPDSHVVYVDNDPIVLAHARALLTSDPDGATDYIDADLRNTGTILAQAARTLDFARPVAVMLVGILQCIPDEDDPRGIVAALMDGVPPGSYLAISHPAADVHAEARAGAALLSEGLASPVTFRTRAAIARFFGGLELIEPGLVSTSQWRSGAGAGHPAPGQLGRRGPQGLTPALPRSAAGRGRRALKLAGVTGRWRLRSAQQQALRPGTHGLHQGGIVGQQALMQAAQLGAGFQAHLRDHDPVPRPVDVERIRPAAQPVQRQHELAPQQLTQRHLGQPGGQLGHDHLRAPEREIRLGLGLDGQHAAFRQRAGGRPEDGRDGIREGGPPPQGERVGEQLRGQARLPRGQRPPALRRQPVELGQVELDAFAAQRVPRPGGQQRPAPAARGLAERPPQGAHMRLDLGP